VHGSNARIKLSLSQTSKNAVFLIIAYAFSSTKLKKRSEQILPGSEGVWGKERGGWEQGERWSKQCMHI
jgi:hypothetical protein